MTTEKFLGLILKLFCFALCVIAIINIMFGKYSIFNYFKYKKSMNTLIDIEKAKQKEKKILLIKTNLLNNSNAINLDIVEQEAIKKLKQIPKNYFIIIE